MIDLHLHLLPGVDDGALDLAQAVAMCRQAVADGCTMLVATPHQRRDEWETADGTALAARLAELQAAVGAEPRLLLGAEVRIDSDLLADLAGGNGSARHRPLPLAGSRYLLLELEPNGLGPEPVALALDLRAEGWWPIFAHPELTPALACQPEVIARLVEVGALLQVTAASAAGELGRAPREQVSELLDAGLVHFVASDAHRPDWRPPGLSRARTEIARRWGEPLAHKLTLDHPLAVIEGRPLSQPASPEAA